jgi:hypothetical protein
MAKRIIAEHKINPANDRLNVTVMDEPSHGGANHAYEISGFDDGQKVLIGFQNGPIAEHGVNGLTHEVLLAIVIDRLRAFQAGAFACRENALALTKLEESQHWLLHRTRARMNRGVEGTNAA